MVFNSGMFGATIAIRRRHCGYSDTGQLAQTVSSITGIDITEKRVSEIESGKEPNAGEVAAFSIVLGKSEVMAMFRACIVGDEVMRND